jgi:hypothetical protein
LEVASDQCLDAPLGSLFVEVLVCRRDHQFRGREGLDDRSAGDGRWSPMQ